MRVRPTVSTERLRNRDRGCAAATCRASVNLPANDLIADGRLKPPAALLAVFEAAHVNLTRPMIASCGSGVTAAILVFALETLGRNGVSLYDGSWAEWGARDDTPISQA